MHQRSRPRNRRSLFCPGVRLPGGASSLLREETQVCATTGLIQDAGWRERGPVGDTGAEERFNLTITAGDRGGDVSLRCGQAPGQRIYVEITIRLQRGGVGSGCAPCREPFPPYLPCLSALGGVRNAPPLAIPQTSPFYAVREPGRIRPHAGASPPHEGRRGACTIPGGIRYETTHG